VEEKMVRGAVTIGANAYLFQRHPGAAANGSSDASLSKGGWYPLQHTVEAYRAVAALNSDAAKRNDELIECGKFIGHEATNSFLRLLIKFLNPAVFARKFPEFWSRDHNFGTVSVDNSEFKDRKLVINLSGVEGYDFIGPVCAGWIHKAFESMGVKGLKVKETKALERANSPEYRFELSWD
jgi:hypothetical protein